MTMFEVFAHDVLVGHSALELGDPPMGVAFGKFIATESYRRIQRECRTNHADQSGLALSVTTPEGIHIPCVGVGIVDLSDQFEDEIEVTVFGIPYPLYGELFPEHVSGYEAKFGEC
jgi:hypothetical protein